jgi:hypothetical protein
MRSSPLKKLLGFAFAALMVTAADPGLAQKLVNPDAVAPEHRAAAEQRRAEQIKIVACQHKADEAKVLPRDRAAHVNKCLEASQN